MGFFGLKIKPGNFCMFILTPTKKSGRISFKFTKRHVGLRRRGKNTRNKKNFKAPRPLALDVLSVVIGK
jgi:hypothetical protein